MNRPDPNCEHCYGKGLVMIRMPVSGIMMPWICKCTLRIGEHKEESKENESTDDRGLMNGSED